MTGSAQTQSTQVDFVMRCLEFIRQAMDGLREQLDTIRAQQWDVTWRNYVHEFFAEHPTDSEVRRRRNLLLDLSTKATPVAASELRVISGRVAEAYAKRSAKTLQRDIDALQEQGLVVKMGNGYLANKARILAFLPARRSLP